jgi:hypothetical protein
VLRFHPGAPELGEPDVRISRIRLSIKVGFIKDFPTPPRT